jgi:hypothetical protein
MIHPYDKFLRFVDKLRIRVKWNKHRKSDAEMLIKLLDEIAKENASPQKEVSIQLEESLKRIKEQQNG